MSKVTKKEESAFASLILQMAADTNVQILDATNAFGNFIDHEHGQEVGVLALDFLLKGGLPNGRFHQIYGPSMAGKTTLVTRAMGMSQQRKRPIIHIDAEYAADIHYMRVLGLDMKNTANYAYAQPHTGDDAFRLVKRTLEQWADVMPGQAGPLVVIDSLKALTPGAFMESDDKNPIGLQARMFSTWMPPIKALVGQTGAILLGVNQVRQNPMAQFGNPETVPGGEALTFFSDSILRLSRVGKTEEAEWGNSVTQRIMFKKLKHATPGESLDLQLIQGIGYDPTIDIWVFLEKTLMGVNTSGYYSINPYEGLPELPEGIEAGKNYRWNDLRPFMIPEPGRHYSTAPLYHWCAHILYTGKIFEAINAYNATQAVEEKTTSISSADMGYDFSALWNSATPAAVKEDIAEGEARAGGKAKKNNGKKGAKTEYCLNEYDENGRKDWIGHPARSNYYDDWYGCTIKDVLKNGEQIEVTWDSGEIETVPVGFVFVSAAATATV